MKRMVVVVIAGWLAGCGSSHPSLTPPAAAVAQARSVLSPMQVHAIPIGTAPPESAPCPQGYMRHASCQTRERDDIRPIPESASPAAGEIPGYHPQDLQAAYELSPSAGGTIAIVVPYSDAHAESDLAVYRAKFGLPPCTTETHCLRFVTASKEVEPEPNDAWAIEESIDLDMASAACPACRLIVVQAASDRLHDMAGAEEAAIALHPAVVSNSWSIPESTQLAGELPAFSHVGVPVVAGTGDSGLGVSWPASDPSVIAVGGTTLMPDEQNARGFTETGWTQAGYGCSAIFARPAWQTGTGCSTRAVADVSSVADPATGVAIYDSQPTGEGRWGARAGWEVYGGTSVAAPIVAAAIAQAGNSAELSTPQFVYEHAMWLNRVQPGASALQAGLGSPNGTAAF